MALIQKIPLQSETTDQTVGVELDNNIYNLRVLWNERFGYFSLSVLTADEQPILTNIKMVKNYPLIGRFKDIRLPFGDFYFIQEKGSSTRPSYSDLLVNFNLYYHEADQLIASQPVREQVAEPIIGTIFDSGLTDWDSGATLWDQ
jgi:hypothetical protein